jgi:hypothetical protein
VNAHESGVFEGTRYVFNNSTNIGMAGVPAELCSGAPFSPNAADQLAKFDRNQQERFKFKRPRLTRTF